MSGFGLVCKRSKLARTLQNGFWPAGSSPLPFLVHFHFPSSPFSVKKTLVLLAALALTTAGTAFAQTAPAALAKPQKSPEQKADRHASHLAKDLGLNPDQEARVEKLMLAREQETAVLKAKYGADRKAGRVDMKAAHDRYQAQFREILTPEQYAKFEQQKHEHRDKMQDGGKMKSKNKA